jgi:hypothetical protein
MLNTLDELLYPPKGLLRRDCRTFGEEYCPLTECNALLGGGGGGGGPSLPARMYGVEHKLQLGNTL